MTKHKTSGRHLASQQNRRIFVYYRLSSERGLVTATPVMPIATPAQYRAMLDAAQQGGYAYPAVNVTSIITINGALRRQAVINENSPILLACQLPS